MAEINYHKPELRPESRKIRKNILLIGGKSGMGKTHLSNDLINQNIGYISLDKFLFSDDLVVEEIKKYVLEKNIHKDNVNSADIVISKCINDYIDNLVEVINKMKQNTILIDGHLLEKNYFKHTFLDKVKFNVWSVTKIKNVNR